MASRRWLKTVTFEPKLGVCAIMGTTIVADVPDYQLKEAREIRRRGVPPSDLKLEPISKTL